jgi:hypothetical protein
MLAALATGIAGATTFSAAELTADGDGLALRGCGPALPVRRDVVGASGQRALAASVHVARALGMDERDIAAYLAP